MRKTLSVLALMLLPAFTPERAAACPIVGVPAPAVVVTPAPAASVPCPAAQQPQVSVQAPLNVAPSFGFSATPFFGFNTFTPFFGFSTFAPGVAVVEKVVVKKVGRRR